MYKQTGKNFSSITSEGKATTGLLLYNWKNYNFKEKYKSSLSLIRFTALHKLLNHELTSAFD